MKCWRLIWVETLNGWKSFEAFESCLIFDKLWFFLEDLRGSNSCHSGSKPSIFWYQLNKLSPRISQNSLKMNFLISFSINDTQTPNKEITIFIANTQVYTPSECVISLLSTSILLYNKFMDGELRRSATHS